MNMSQGYNYRKVFYKDYFNSQSGRVFHLNLKKKMEREENLLSKEILPLLPADKSLSVLDIGCGFGSFIYTLKKHGYTLVKGIDLSEGQVRIAHEMGLAEVEQQDLIPYLTSHKNTFDIITGLDIIEHFSKDELVEVLSLVKESLKPGGTALFRTPNMDAPFATLFAHGDFTHENYLNCSSANQVMMNIGFVNIVVRSSHLETEGPAKELIRKIVWGIVSACIKLIVFASARSTKDMILTPNLLIRAEKEKA